MAILFLDVMVIVEQGIAAIGSFIVLAKVWDKTRPVIIAKTDDDQLTRENRWKEFSH